MKLTRKSIKTMQRLEQSALPAPWEAEIGKDDEFIHQTIDKTRVKPILHLAQLTSKEKEIRLLVLLRNNAKTLLEIAESHLSK